MLFYTTSKIHILESVTNDILLYLLIVLCDFLVMTSGIGLIYVIILQHSLLGIECNYLDKFHNFFFYNSLVCLFTIRYDIGFQYILQLSSSCCCFKSKIKDKEYHYLIYIFFIFFSNYYLRVDLRDLDNISDLYSCNYWCYILQLLVHKINFAACVQRKKIIATTGA